MALAAACMMVGLAVAIPMHWLFMADPARAAGSCTNRGKLAGGAGCQGGTERSRGQGAGSCKGPGEAGEHQSDPAGRFLKLLGARA